MLRVLAIVILTQNCPGGVCPSPGYSYQPQMMSPTFVRPASPMSYDGYPIVPGSVRIVAAPSTTVRRTVVQREQVPVKTERIPTAAPGPPLTAREEAPSSPVVKPPQVQAPIGPPPMPTRPAAPQGDSGDTVIVPVPANPRFGYQVHLPDDSPAPTTGLPAPNSPSAVQTDQGNTLPNYAVTGMLWRPNSGKDGLHASQHAESHRFVEDLGTGAPLPNLVDDTGKYRVTVISRNPEDRKQAVEDLKRGNGPLAPFKDLILVRSGSPGDWITKDVGLEDIPGIANGTPGVVIQEPNGKVAYAVALASYSPEQTADALRKANPAFDPKKVPGPKVGEAVDWDVALPYILGAVALAFIFFATKKSPSGS